MRIPDASHFYQHLTLFNFSNSSGCIAVSHWYCHLHLSKDAENVFIGLLGMSITSFVKYVLRCFAPFPNCFICSKFEGLNVPIIKESPLWNILIQRILFSVWGSSPQFLDSCWRGSWRGPDRRLTCEPDPSLRSPWSFPGLEAASRAKPWDRSVLLKSSGQHLWLNPGKALVY